MIYQGKKELGLLGEEKSEFEMIDILSNYISDKKQRANCNIIKPQSLFRKNRKWKFFNIREVFNRIEPTKGKTTYDLVSGDEIAYVAAKKKDNGFDYFVSKDGNDEYISDGNGIVFVNLGDGSGGYSVYQPDAFIGMNGKTSVGYAPKLNKYNALFLVTILDKQRYKYSFGRSWTGERFNTTQLYLPCKKDETIDWDFMERYIRSLPNGDII